MPPQIHYTVTAALDDVGVGRVQVLLLLYCGLAWLADACETMLLSFLGPAVRCSWGVGAAAESMLTSVVFVGMLSGVYCLGVVSDHLGRRRGFLASALLLGAAGLASALAPSFAWLLALRAVVGFALGGTPIAVTLFAEWCTSEGRGRWLLLLQSFWTVGTVLEALLAAAVLPGLGWRWLLALSAAPLGLLLALYPFLPESPHWLVSQQRYGEAEAVLQRVAALNGRQRPLQLHLAPRRAAWNADLVPSAAIGPGGVRSRSPQVVAIATSQASPSTRAPLLAAAASPAQRPSVDGEQQRADRPQPAQPQPASQDVGSGDAACIRKRRLRELLRTLTTAFSVVFGPQLRRTTLLLYAIWAINALTYYGLVLLTTALQTAAKKEECTPGGQPNLDDSDYKAILITTLAEAPGLLAAALLIDGRGRRWTLRAGLVACASALAGLLADPGHGGALALLFAARACIEGTFACLYVYSPELYPTHVRSVGVALCNGFSRLGGFLAPFATVYLVAGGHAHAAEALLAGLCGGAALCAFMLPFETAGCDLQSGELAAAAHGGKASGGDGHGGEEGGLLAGAERQSIDSEAELVPARQQAHGERQQQPPLPA